MKLVKTAYVVFMNGNKESTKKYEYVIGKNVNLREGAIYDICADGNRTYDNPVKVVAKGWNDIDGSIDLRTITSAKLLVGPERKVLPVKKVVFNKKKGTTTILWTTGGSTTVHCAEGDEWDEEKALALCFLKGYCKNGSYYNDYLREWIKDAERY